MLRCFEGVNANGPLIGDAVAFQGRGVGWWEIDGKIVLGSCFSSSLKYGHRSSRFEDRTP